MFRRPGVTYKRNQGSREIVRPGTFVKADKDIEIMKNEYPEYFKYNFDESPILSRDTGDYSFRKDANLPRVQNSVDEKARVTVACFLDQSGQQCFKGHIINRNLTTDLSKSTKLYDKKAEQRMVKVRSQIPLKNFKQATLIVIYQ